MEQYLKLKRAFSNRLKPKHFMDPKHCKECEHKETVLMKNDNESISFELVGRMGSSPMASSSIEGILYYLPGLARLSAGGGDDYFLDQFIVYIDDDRLMADLQVEEAKALREYLEWLSTTNSSEIERNGDDIDLNDVIDRLQSLSSRK
jgi:hypothetical protein